jgi:hypothetical protein
LVYRLDNIKAVSDELKRFTSLHLRKNWELRIAELLLKQAAGKNKALDQSSPARSVPEASIKYADSFPQVSYK